MGYSGGYAGIIASGEIIVGTAAAQFSALECREVIFKAGKANAGTVYIGGSGVTVAGTVSNTTAGLQLIAGDTTPTITVNNLSAFYGIASAADQVVTYLVTR